MTNWRVLGASVAGKQHIRSGLPCQDSAAYRAPAGDGAHHNALIAAVADGAGSAPRAACGSRLAARAALAKASNLLQSSAGPAARIHAEDILIQSIYYARRCVEDQAGLESADLRDFATTLLLAIHTGEVLAAAQIGDGAIVYAESDGNCRLLTTPQRGEFANETRFLTAASIQPLQISSVASADIRQIAMFTDGIQPLVLNYGVGMPLAPHPGFFARIFGWLDSQPDDLQAYIGLRSFLKNNAAIQARVADDITLVLASRPEEIKC